MNNIYTVLIIGIYIWVAYTVYGVFTTMLPTCTRNYKHALFTIFSFLFFCICTWGVVYSIIKLLKA